MVISCNEYSRTYYSQGNVLLVMKRPTAIASYGSAIAVGPNHANAYSNHGASLQDVSLPEAAAESFNQAIALKPDHAKTYHNHRNAPRTPHHHAAVVTSYDNTIALQETSC
jgi:tetratricopeptide (TPR) repeat protein